MSNLPTESQNQNNNQEQKDYITLNIYQNNNQRYLNPVLNQTEANLKLNDNHLIQNKNEFAYLDNTRENQNPNFNPQQKFPGNAGTINQAQKDTNSTLSDKKRKEEIEKKAEEEKKRREHNKKRAIKECICLSIFLPILGCIIGGIFLLIDYLNDFKDRKNPYDDD